MKKTSSKYIIIGAGLSGLTSGYLLQQAGENNIVILESRDRIGGRIFTKDDIDYGATWFHNHHTQVIQLLDRLRIKKFHQYTKGKSVLVYSSMAPAHEFESDPSAPSAYRIAGGSKALIEALAAPLQESIYCNAQVHTIEETVHGIRVITDDNVFEAEEVIITMPPKIAQRIQYIPELSEVLTRAMDSTHTWMSNAMKVGMTFDQPFWRTKNYSGTVIGQIGAVTELYDHTSSDEKTYTLMGFVNEGLRDLSPEKRKERILDYLSKYLGQEIRDYTSYDEKDWSMDSHTSCVEIKSVYISPEYGNPMFQDRYMKEKLIFSGAETAIHHGGYMDGAILSGITAVEKLLDQPIRSITSN